MFPYICCYLCRVSSFSASGNTSTGSGDNAVVCNCGSNAKLLTVKKEGANQGNVLVSVYDGLVMKICLSSLISSLDSQVFWLLFSYFLKNSIFTRTVKFKQNRNMSWKLATFGNYFRPELRWFITLSYNWWVRLLRQYFLFFFCKIRKQHWVGIFWRLV